MSHKINHANIKEWAANYDGPLFDGILCDPPYELGFMGKSWDSSGIAFDTDMWADLFKLVKPGGHLLAFSGSRTYHRMAVAIEDAGFEIRDMIEYIYGSGFPKSTNIYKQLKKQCTCGSMEAYENGAKQDTKHDLRPMQDTDIPQTSPTKGEAELVLQSSVSEQGVHGTVQGQKPSQSIENGEEPSVEGRSDLQEVKGQLQGSDIPEVSREVSADGEKRRLHNATQASDGSTPGQTADENGSGTSHRPQSEQQSDREPCTFCKQWGTQAARSYGTGSALKPAHEPICLARKPLEGTLASNYLKHGTGGLNIDGTRVEANSKELYRKPTEYNDISPNASMNASKVRGSVTEDYLKGRFPANLIHDGSDEVEAVFPQTKSTIDRNPINRGTSKSWYTGDHVDRVQRGDSGSASRYFFTAKPDLYCSLCYGIMEVCENNAQNAQTTSQLGTQANNTAHDNVAVKQVQEPKDSKPNKTNNAHNAVNSSASTNQTTESIVQPNATQNLKELTDLLVKYVGNQCQKCSTNTAQSLAAILLSGEQINTGQQTKTLLWLNELTQEQLLNILIEINSLAKSAVNQTEELNDTTQIIRNLKKLYGSVNRTISESTQARFKYQSKASKRERNAGLEGFEEKPNLRVNAPRENEESKHSNLMSNHHPTVKPLSLTKYLATLIKPPTGGRLLVPFSGSGSEMIGALQAGWEYVEGVELTEEYIPIAEARIKYWVSKPVQESLL